MPKLAKDALPNELLRYEREQRNWTLEDVVRDKEHNCERIKPPPASRVVRKKLRTKPVADEVDIKMVGKWERGTITPTPHYRRQLATLFGRSERELGYPEQGIPFWNIEQKRNGLFTAREDIFVQLAHLPTLRDQYNSKKRDNQLPLQQRPQVLTGLGGIGKTQIVIEYAFRSQDKYHTIILLNADSTTGPASWVTTIAKVLDIEGYRQADQKKMTDKVNSWLSSPVLTRWLLIFDNVDSSETLQNVLQFLPTKFYGHVLLTTRMHDVGPQDQVEQIEIDSLPPEDGATFLLRRSKRLAADASITNGLEKDRQDLPDEQKATQDDFHLQTQVAERQEALTITQMLGGLPLALDQAGAYIAGTGESLAGYSALYEMCRAELLRYRGKYGKIFNYPETVATTWLLNFNQLELAAKELLCFFAFLEPDNIPEELINYLSGNDNIFGMIFKPNPALSATMKDIVSDKDLLNTVIERLDDDPNLGPHELRMASRLIPEVFTGLAEGRALFAPGVGSSLLSIAKDKHLLNLALENLCDYSLINRHVEARAVSIHRLVQAVIQDRMNEEERREWACRAIGVVAYICPGAPGINIKHWPRFQRYLLPHILTCARLTRQWNISVQLEYVQLVDAGLLFDATGEYLVRQCRYTEAEPILHLSLTIFETTAKGLFEVHLIRPFNTLARLFNEQGRFTEAEPLHQRAVAICEQAHFGGWYLPLTLMFLAEHYRVRGKYAEAEPLYQRAIDYCEQHRGLKDDSMIFVLGCLADLYYDQGKYAEAEPLYQKVVAFDERQADQEEYMVDIAYFIAGLARVSHKQGSYSEAERLCLKALAIRERIFYSDHYYVAGSFNDLANIYRDQGKFAEAEPLYQRALMIYEHINAREYSKAECLNDLALFYYKQDKYPRAKAQYQLALAINERLFDSDHPQIALNLHGLANIYRDQGKFAEAEPLYLRALAIFEKNFGTEHPYRYEILDDYLALLKLMNS